MEDISHAQAALAKARGKWFRPWRAVYDAAMHLGRLQQGAGLLVDAEASFREARLAAEEAFSPADSRIEGATVFLAFVLISQGKVEEAEACRERLDAIVQRDGPSSHNHVGCVYARLATLYHTRNEDERALALAHRSLEILRASHGECHVEIAQTLAILADALVGLGRHDDAGKAYSQALTMQAEIVGHGSRRTVSIVMAYARFCLQQHQVSKAVAVLEPVLAHASRAVLDQDASLRERTAEVVSLLQTAGSTDLANAIDTWLKK